MKHLKDYIYESQSADNVYAVYFHDGVLDTYYNDKEDAEKRAEELNKEVPSNKCVVKEEPRSNFEKQEA